MSRSDELSKLWDEASKESGFHDKEMTRVKAHRSRDRFYELFFKKTGLHPSYVMGAFMTWQTIPHEEATELRRRHGGHAFCAYLADLQERAIHAHRRIDGNN
jgi:hypothetical protein